MSTNYYLHRPFKETIHIGKSSAGWCFALHVTDKIKSLEDWKKLFSNITSTIKDEYGERISTSQMIDVITNRSWPISRDLTPHSVHGPNNLYRNVIDGHCIANGEGTWDLITGDFE